MLKASSLKQAQQQDASSLPQTTASATTSPDSAAPNENGIDSDHTTTATESQVLSSLSSSSSSPASNSSTANQQQAPNELDELFKARVNEFLKNAREECREQEETFGKCKAAFKNVITAYCVKPRPGESEVTSEYFFSLWVEFSHHFKDAWKRETQKLAKQR